MFAFLKKIKIPKTTLTCLSILAVVLAMLYFTGFINKDKLPFEHYEEENPAEDKNAIDKVADVAKAFFGIDTYKNISEEEKKKKKTKKTLIIVFSVLGSIVLLAGMVATFFYFYDLYYFPSYY